MLIAEEGPGNEYVEAANDCFESFMQALALRAWVSAEESGDADEYLEMAENDADFDPAESLGQTYWEEDYSERAETFFRALMDELQADYEFRTWDEIAEDALQEIFLPTFVDSFGA